MQCFISACTERCSEHVPVSHVKPYVFEVRFITLHAFGVAGAIKLIDWQGDKCFYAIPLRVVAQYSNVVRIGEVDTIT